MSMILNRLPVRWDKTVIVVMNEVRVSSPYLPESVSGGTAAANERVKKVVRLLTGWNFHSSWILVWKLIYIRYFLIQLEFERKRLQARGSSQGWFHLCISEFRRSASNDTMLIVPHLRYHLISRKHITYLPRWSKASLNKFVALISSWHLWLCFGVLQNGAIGGRLLHLIGNRRWCFLQCACRYFIISIYIFIFSFNLEITKSIGRDI